MSNAVVVADYGSGNIFTVSRALEFCGATVHLSSDPAEIRNAERLVVPGVGAFEHVMHALRERGFDDAIRGFAETARPFLGICVGMQMMLDYSEEFGCHKGFGFIPGKVTAIPTVGGDGRPHPVPHVGWSAIHPGGCSWEGTPLAATAPGTDFYFVHSFTAAPDNASNILAEGDYDGQPIVAAVMRDNMVGFQFHPEKSGPSGLAVLENFVTGKGSRNVA